MITHPADPTTETARAQKVLGKFGCRYGSRAQSALRSGLSNPEASCAIMTLLEPARREEALTGEALGPLPRDAIGMLEHP
jgi:hypothetical protein